MKALLPSLLLVPALFACGGGAPAGTGLTVVKDKALDAPLRGSSAAEKDRFLEGDVLFDLVFTPADGLGPLYIRTSCVACHQEGLSGPAGVQKMVVVDSSGAAQVDQSALAYGNTVRPFTAGYAHTPISIPKDLSLKISLRLGPVVLGRGYMEAVADSEIERVEAEQELRGEVSGRIHRVTFTSEPNPDTRFHRHTKGEGNLIGRFGYKARIATLDDFSADALQGDMGLTSPMRPHELPNPDGLVDDDLAGADVSVEMVNAMADYLRLLEIPARPPENAEGAALFAQVGCSSCHVPSLRTRADYPIRALADVDAPLYSDLLLHDMGEGLADGVIDGAAGPREWRTPPLVGVSLLRNFLHDGRAQSVEAAVVEHQSEGSEANSSVARFQALSESQRAALIDFVQKL